MGLFHFFGFLGCRGRPVVGRVLSQLVESEYVVVRGAVVGVVDVVVVERRSDVYLVEKHVVELAARGRGRASRLFVDFFLFLLVVEVQVGSLEPVRVELADDGVLFEVGRHCRSHSDWILDIHIARVVLVFAAQFVEGPVLLYVVLDVREHRVDVLLFLPLDLFLYGEPVEIYIVESVETVPVVPVCSCVPRLVTVYLVEIARVDVGSELVIDVLLQGEMGSSWFLCSSSLFPRKTGVLLSPEHHSGRGGSLRSESGYACCKSISLLDLLMHPTDSLLGGC